MPKARPIFSGLIPFMMVAAFPLPGRLSLPWLLPGRVGSKVEGIASRTLCRSQALVAAHGGSPLTSRLRELIQQLGEAIHESVIESEQIAGVVQDIRKHGFDVLLMLEATIGLNEVGAKNADSAEAGEEVEGEAGAFTQNDLHFLKSLRISVEGDDEASEDATSGE
jgi:hypothetical protein